MDHRDVTPLRDENNKVLGYFVKGATKPEEFAAAVSARYWPWLRNSVNPPMAERNEAEMAKLIASQAGAATMRWAGNRYQVEKKPKKLKEGEEWPRPGAFEAMLVNIEDLYRNSGKLNEDS